MPPSGDCSKTDPKLKSRVISFLHKSLHSYLIVWHFRTDYSNDIPTRCVQFGNGKAIEMEVIDDDISRHLNVRRVSEWHLLLQALLTKMMGFQISNFSITVYVYVQWLLIM